MSIANFSQHEVLTAEKLNAAFNDLEAAMEELPDGSAVSAKVAEHTTEIDELEEKVDELYGQEAIDLNITDYFTANTGEKANESLEIEDVGSDVFYANQYDVSKYIGGTVSFYGYGYCGFILEDGILSGVTNIQSYSTLQSWTIPENAQYVVLTSASSLVTSQTIKISRTATEGVIDKLKTLTPIVEANAAETKKISGLKAISEKDILSDGIITESAVFDSSLNVQSSSDVFEALKFDMSNYQCGTVTFKAYGYCGFILSDGSVTNVINISQYKTEHVWEIPDNAKYLCITFATSLGVVKEAVINRTAQDEISVRMKSVESHFNKSGNYAYLSYNDYSKNFDGIKLFMGLYKQKLVDEYNRLVVSFNGDSIIGSQLDDLTVSPEYTTYDFPPNMSKMIMARKFYDAYKFANEDVVFRNIQHSDWNKNGFDQPYAWQDSSKTFNEIETFGCSSNDDYAEITVNGYKYFKLIWSGASPAGWWVDVLVSIDGGDYKAPSAAGIDLPDTIKHTNAGTNEGMVTYKICELDASKTYKIKVMPNQSVQLYENITFWGCEMWNNKRLDVVVEAVSGSTAKQQAAGDLTYYYSDWHKPQLIISDILAINDNAYITSGSETVQQWIDGNNKIYDYIKEHNIALLLFDTHSSNTIASCAAGIATQRNLPVILIKQKMSANGTALMDIVNHTDGLHLSDVGQTYYFEELQKIFELI